MVRNLLPCRHILNVLESSVASLSPRKIVHPFWWKTYYDLNERDEIAERLTPVYNEIGFKPMLPYKVVPVEPVLYDHPKFTQRDLVESVHNWSPGTVREVIASAGGRGNV